MRRALSLVLCAVATGLAPGARALDGGANQLALSGGYARLAVDGAAGGGVVRLEGQHGLSDALALHVTLGATPVGGVPPLLVTAGVTYAIDVVRVVPFLEAGLALDYRAGALARGDGGVEAGLGGEYLLDRRWALALVARYAYLPLRLAAPASSTGRPQLLTAALRLGVTF